jgi:hypothetical protein
MATLQIDKGEYSSAATTLALLDLGSVNAVCAVPTMVIGTPTVSQNDDSFTFQDTLGSKTSTVTPSSISSS